MVQTRKMNASMSAMLLKNLTSAVELIRARQEEKQAVLDEFDAEKKRFFFGKISERALAHSVKKTNAELKRLDSQIRTAIKQGTDLSDRSRKLCSIQNPIGFRATMTGISGSLKKKVTKKKAVKKKVSKKKPVKRKAKKKK